MIFYINENGKFCCRRLDAEILMDDILDVEEITNPKDMKWAVEQLC